MVLSAVVHADDRNDDEDDRGPQSYLAAGARVSVEQSVYAGGKERVLLLPLVFAQWGPVYLRGPALGSYLYAGDQWRVSAGVALDLRDTRRGESPELADMAELDNVLLGEVEASRHADWGELNFSFAADIGADHDGHLAGLSYAYPLEIGRFQLEPKVRMEWRSAKVNQYYYGVSAADVRITRPRYEPEADVSHELGVTVVYPFAERHTLQIEASTEWLSAEVSDSPIVERNNFANVGVVYLFRF